MGQTMLSRSRAGMIAAGLAMTFTNIAPAQADQRMTLPVGTVIPVKLNQQLSSKTSQPGDWFTATVKEGRDDAGLPYGTRIEGVVREALPSRDGKAGVLDVEFRRLVIPDRENKAIDGTLYSLNGKDVKRSDGRLVATADKSKDRLKWVGIGAGAGFLIGTLTKGNSLVDALLGAGAGYLYNELQGKKAGDVNLKEGTEFGVRLERAVVVNIDDQTYSRFRDRLRNETDPDDPYFRDDRYRDDRERDRYDDDRYYRRDDLNTPRANQRARDRASDRSRLNRDIGEIGMVIDRREVRFTSAKPFMRNNVVFVPIEPVSKAMDVQYQFDSTDKLIRTRDNKVRLNVGSRVAFVDGERRLLPAPAETRNGVVYVPMQFIGWLADGIASWDSASRTVIVRTDRN